MKKVIIVMTVAAVGIVIVYTVVRLLKSDNSAHPEQPVPSIQDSTDTSEEIAVPDSVKEKYWKGVDFYQLDSTEAERLFRKLDTALDGYHKKHRIYPSVQGKYFLGSLIEYTPKLEQELVYVYIDTTTNRKVERQWRKVEMLSDLQQNKEWRDHCFIGLGISASYLVYLPPGGDRKSYRLYWVGRNELDEKGKGDDIVYKPER